MIFGTPPFYNRDQEKMFKDIQNRPLFFDDSKVNLSIEGKKIVTGLLQKNPNERLGAKGA
jgi:hypothetical protein